jgi:hypothetical protein
MILTCLNWICERSLRAERRVFGEHQGGGTSKTRPILDRRSTHIQYAVYYPSSAVARSKAGAQKQVASTKQRANSTKRLILLPSPRIELGVRDYETLVLPLHQEGMTCKFCNCTNISKKGTKLLSAMNQISKE